MEDRILGIGAHFDTVNMTAGKIKHFKKTSSRLATIFFLSDSHKCSLGGSAERIRSGPPLAPSLSVCPPFQQAHFPFKSFCSCLKKSTLPATAVQFFTLTSNLHKVTSFLT